MFTLTLFQVIKMCLMLLVGFICYKRKIVSEEGNRSLSNILLLIINPLLIFQSFQVEKTPELLHSFLLSLIVCICIFAILIPLGTLLLSRGESRDRAVERFSVIYSNCGFMGIPIINALLGSRGVLLLTPYMAVFNFVVWTHGLLLMTGSTNTKQLKKGLTSPVIFAMILGFIFFLTGISLPPILSETVASISGMNTPVAMLVAGVALAQSDLKKALQNPRLYLVAAIKLVLLPLILLLVFAWMPVSSDVLCINLIAAACPTAATCTMFSLRYGRDYHYASEIYAFTTIMSMLTIPAYVFLLEQFIL